MICLKLDEGIGFANVGHGTSERGRRVARLHCSQTAGMSDMILARVRDRLQESIV